MTRERIDEDRHERFERLLDAYGADPARWPADERPAFAALQSALPNNPALAHSFAAARALDAALGGIDVAPVDDLRAQRVQQAVLHAVAGSRPARAPAPPPGRLWLRAVAALLPLVIGVGAGLSDRGDTATDGADATGGGFALVLDDETQYANEATQAPYVLASHLDGVMAGGGR